LRRQRQQAKLHGFDGGVGGAAAGAVQRMGGRHAFVGSGRRDGQQVNAGLRRIDAAEQATILEAGNALGKWRRFIAQHHIDRIAQIERLADAIQGETGFDMHLRPLGLVRGGCDFQAPGDAVAQGNAQAAIGIARRACCSRDRSSPVSNRPLKKLTERIPPSRMLCCRSLGWAAMNGSLLRRQE
jgi:hypothetical protein